MFWGRVLRSCLVQTAFVLAVHAAVGTTSSTLLGEMPNLFPGRMPNGAMGGGLGDMAMMQSMLSDVNILHFLKWDMIQFRFSHGQSWNKNALACYNIMMRNNPRFANNPMLQQTLTALQSNPEMTSKVSQMM